MESYRTSNSNRFVFDEDSIIRATSDGEPHETLTLIAGVSGLVTAILILAVVVALIGCKDSENVEPNENPEMSLSMSASTSSSNADIFLFNKNINQNNLNIIESESKSKFACVNYSYEVENEIKPENQLKFPEISTGKF